MPKNCNCEGEKKSNEVVSDHVECESSSVKVLNSISSSLLLNVTNTLSIPVNGTGSAFSNINDRMGNPIVVNNEVTTINCGSDSASAALNHENDFLVHLLSNKLYLQNFELSCHSKKDQIYSWSSTVNSKKCIPNHIQTFLPFKNIPTLTKLNSEHDANNGESINNIANKCYKCDFEYLVKLSANAVHAIKGHIAVQGSVVNVTDKRGKSWTILVAPSSNNINICDTLVNFTFVGFQN